MIVLHMPNIDGGRVGVGVWEIGLAGKTNGRMYTQPYPTAHV